MNLAQLQARDRGEPIAQLGYAPDRPKAPGARQDFDAAAVLGAAPILDRASAAAFFVGLLNQWPLNSCVAFAALYAIEGAMLRQGVTREQLKRLSRMWGYLMSRLLHDARNDDDGTFIRLFFEACAKVGFTTEEAWPYLADFVEGVERWKATPSDDAQRIASDTLGKIGVNYHRVYDTGYELVDALKRATMAGKMWVGGFQVSTDFASNRHPIGEYLPPPVGMKIAGGHALCGVEYTPEGPSGPNSWDDEEDTVKWGRDGWWDFSWEYVADARYAWDFWIVDVAPLFPDTHGWGRLAA